MSKEREPGSGAPEGLPKSGATDGAAGDEDHLVQIFAAPDVAKRRVPAVLQAKVIGP